jgi:hypothetical protein
VGNANASTLAVTLDVEPTNSWSWPGATIGWEFTTSTNLNITSLGVWDHMGDGLGDSHDVGIFALDGTLLTSTVVNAGIGNTLDGGFRWANVPGYALAMGTYVVGAYMPTGVDNGAAQSSYLSATEVTFNRNLYLYRQGFILPTTHWNGFDGGNFGANFKFGDVSPVPVPAAVW